jgi:hypothetical protein
MYRGPDSLFVLTLKEKRIMDLSPFVSSDPAARRDGWSPERKLRFLDRLTACGNVSAACAAVGLSRDSAYVLRRRDALFARGWATALELARERSVELLADKATEGIEEDVWYRGELVGTKRRFDARLLLAHIARLDKLVEEADPGRADDATRFDEILACIAGAQVPEELRVEDDPLPLDRESAAAGAGREARVAVNEAWAERDAEEPERIASGESHEAFREELETATARARAEVGARWDAWFQGACQAVDALLGRSEAEPEPPADPPVAAEEAREPDGADSSLRTVSDVSGSGPSAGTVASDGAAPHSPETASELPSPNRAAIAVGPDGRRYAYA